MGREQAGRMQKNPGTEDYSALYRELSQADPDSLGTFHLNLTKNLCDDAQSPDPFMLAQQADGTADGYLRSVGELIADERRQQEYFARCSRAELLRQFAGGRAALSMQYPVTAQDGEPLWVGCFLRMAKNTATGDTEAIFYVLDITQRKLEEQLIGRITEDSFDHIGLINPRTGIFELRKKARTFTPMFVMQRLDYETLIGRLLHNVVPEDREQLRTGLGLDNLTAQLYENDSYELVYNGIRLDGSVCRKRLRFCWLDSLQTQILEMQTDITEAYRQEQERLQRMEQALQAAEAASRAKTEFLSRISHDIRTPISIISSMTAFAREDLDDREKLLHDLSHIETSNQFLLSLISDVLDISKIDSGKIELRPEPYERGEYLGNIRNILEPLCQQKGLAFRIEDACEADALLTDKVRLNQITFNLLSNAVKYTPAGGSVTFRFSAARRPDGKLDCTLTVRDTGIGMSQAFQEHMFEPFTQESSNPARPKAETGTGLGLSIVQRLVQLMGGQTKVESALSKGTCITVCFVFPEAAVPARPEQDGNARKPWQTAPLRGRVLLAEDNAMNTEIAVRLLTAFGLQVDCAENGEAAVSRFRASAPGVYRMILMDIQMPVLDGCSAAAAIRAAGRPDSASIPIVAMTADAFTAARDRSRAAGMNDYLTKPLDPAALYELLKKHLQSTGGYYGPL